VVTAYQRGWAELDNGTLLRAAELEFEVFITTDKNLRYQQNVTGYRVAILILPSANWPALRPFAHEIAALVETLKPGDIIEFRLPQK
jgi:hypothetical protein